MEQPKIPNKQTRKQAKKKLGLKIGKVHVAYLPNAQFNNLKLLIAEFTTFRYNFQKLMTGGYPNGVT